MPLRDESLLLMEGIEGQKLANLYRCRSTRLGSMVQFGSEQIDFVFRLFQLTFKQLVLRNGLVKPVSYQFVLWKSQSIVMKIFLPYPRPIAIGSLLTGHCLVG